MTELPKFNDWRDDAREEISAAFIDAISFVWPDIRAAQRAGDQDLAQELARKALAGATPEAIAIFERHVAAINGAHNQ